MDVSSSCSMWNVSKGGIKGTKDFVCVYGCVRGYTCIELDARNVCEEDILSTVHESVGVHNSDYMCLLQALWR